MAGSGTARTTTPASSWVIVHAPGRGGVAGGRVDVPAADLAAGGDQGGGERAAELAEADHGDRRCGHRRHREGGHAGTSDHGRSVRKTRASAVAISRSSWARASIR